MFEFLNPEQVLDQLELKTDMLAAEFGCGSGGFSLALAKRLQEGMVFSLDIQEAPLSALKSRASSEKIYNINIIRCDLEKPRGSTLQDSYLDLVLVPNILFQVKNKEVVISEVKRILKSQGRLLLVDWEKNASVGPETGRLSKDEAKKLLADQGFILEKEFKAGAYHYGLTFKKP